jgi:hypothetical protein
MLMLMMLCSSFSGSNTRGVTGTNEDDFMYYLPDNKEISVCWEMAKSMGFPKLEEGLSAMSKDDLADSLAYNSIKV